MGAGNVKTLIWNRKTLKLIDQRKLPFKEIYITCRTHEDVTAAIKDMIVRGAPAIGVTAAYGSALAAINFDGDKLSDFRSFMYGAVEKIAGSRPTAVNLFWALERIKGIIKNSIEQSSSREKESAVTVLRNKIISEAEAMEKEDVEINKRLGENSLGIFDHTGIPKNRKINVLTHCNAGALATAGYGTALGVVRSLNLQGLLNRVLVDETRPYLQGARLTAWELQQERIPYSVITDNMAGYFMSRGEVDIVVTGADRIAANGDTANKIGTFSLSVLAKYHGIPFYIAAPYSTVDFKTATGKDIKIEQRPENEVRNISGCIIIPEYINVLNPSFDVTPAENITAIITERGMVIPPLKKNLLKNSYSH
jgi:methylthioribose-1-phosphate isomerase